MNSSKNSCRTVHNIKYDFRTDWTDERSAEAGRPAGEAGDSTVQLEALSMASRGNGVLICLGESCLEYIAHTDGYPKREQRERERAPAVHSGRIRRAFVTTHSPPTCPDADTLHA